eukprot:scaffold14925_cov97-Isochrysis_galbana.AAC.3
MSVGGTSPGSVGRGVRLAPLRRRTGMNLVAQPRPGDLGLLDLAAHRPAHETARTRELWHRERLFEERLSCGPALVRAGAHPPVLLIADGHEVSRNALGKQRRRLIVPAAEPRVLQGGAGRGAESRLGGEEEAEHVERIGRHIMVQGAAHVELQGQDALLGRALRRAAEWVRSREEQVEQHSHCPDVDALVVATLQHLGRHVIERTAHLAQPWPAHLHPRRQAKIDQQQPRVLGVRGEQQVLRLQVPMHNPQIVAAEDGLQRVVSDAGGQPLGIGRLLLQQPPWQLPPLAELQHKMHMVQVLPLAKESRHVAVARLTKLRGDVHLARNQLLPSCPRATRFCLGPRARLVNALDRDRLLLGSDSHHRKVYCAESAHADGLGVHLEGAAEYAEIWHDRHPIVQRLEAVRHPAKAEGSAPQLRVQEHQNSKHGDAAFGIAPVFGKAVSQHLSRTFDKTQDRSPILQNLRRIDCDLAFFFV